MSRIGLQNPFNRRAEVANRSWAINKWLVFAMLCIVMIAVVVKGLTWLQGILQTAAGPGARMHEVFA